MIILEVREIGEPWGVTSSHLRALLAQDEVTLLIDSDGGAAMEAVSLAEVIRANGDRVKGYVQGRASSAAAMILMACRRRTGSSGSKIHVHTPFACACGDRDDVGEIYRILSSLDESMRQALMFATGWSDAQARATVDAGTMWSADEAVRIGILQATEELRMQPTQPAAAPAAAVPQPAMHVAQASSAYVCPTTGQLKVVAAPAANGAPVPAAAPAPQPAVAPVAHQPVQPTPAAPAAPVVAHPAAPVVAAPVAAAPAPAPAPVAAPPVEVFGNFQVPMAQVAPAPAAPVAAAPQPEVQPQPVAPVANAAPAPAPDFIGQVAEAVIARLQGATAAATAAPAIAQAAQPVAAAPAPQVQGAVQPAAAAPQPQQVVVGANGQPTRVVVAPGTQLAGATAHAQQATQAMARGPDGQPLTAEEIAADQALARVWPDLNGEAQGTGSAHERLGAAMAEVMQGAMGGPAGV